MTPETSPQPQGQPLDLKKLILQNRTLNLICTWLLYDRSHPLEVSVAMEGLLAERHNHFHSQDTEWRKCGNQVCVNGRMILDNAVKQEVEVNSFGIQLMEQYAVAFMPQIDPATRQLSLIRAKLVERSKVTPAGDIPHQGNGRIIIP